MDADRCTFEITGQGRCVEHGQHEWHRVKWDQSRPLVLDHVEECKVGMEWIELKV